jgi:hypothetical protein
MLFFIIYVMSCPTESHKIDEFDKKPKYAVSETTYASKGVNILKAVKIYQGKDSEEKVKLEDLLGQAVEGSPVDSAWGECKNDCNCESVKRSGSRQLLNGYSIPEESNCPCDINCPCDSHCGTNDNSGT